MPWQSSLYSWAFDQIDAPHPAPNPLLLERMPCNIHQHEAYNQFCLLVNSFHTLWSVDRPSVLSPMQSVVAEWVGTGETRGVEEGLKRRTLLKILQFVLSRPRGSVTMGMLRSDHGLRIPEEVLVGVRPVTFLRSSGFFSFRFQLNAHDQICTVINVVDDYMHVMICASLMTC